MMSAPPINSEDTTSTDTSLLAVQRFLDEEDGDDELDDGDDDDGGVGPNAGTALGAEPLSNAVIGLRGWGARRIYPLRGPHDSRRTVATSTRAGANALLRSSTNLAISANSVELVYEGDDRCDGLAPGRAQLRQGVGGNRVSGIGVTDLCRHAVMLLREKCQYW
jgi:hypothetical protein